MPSLLPDITRPDAGIAVVSRYRPADPAAITSEWKYIPWPEALLSVNWLVSTDGETGLTYAQWTNHEAYQEFSRTNRPVKDRSEPIPYKLYRSATSAGPRRIPGCIVIVSVQFDGPDQQRQRKWIDTVFEALEAETELHPGGISGHFHVSLDGTRVLNYAEWIDENSHRDALEKSGQGAVGSGPKWRDVRNFPGVLSNGFKRYRLLRSLVQPERRNA
jgi:hypothetical protein